MCVCVPTGDLLSGLVGRVCVCVPTRQPAFWSCREGVCVYVSRPATYFRVHTCMYVCNNKLCRGHVVPSYLIHSCVDNNW